MICRICLKNRFELNSDSVCCQCQARLDRERKPVIFQRTSSSKACVFTPSGLMLSRADWIRFKRWIDTYYACVSDEEIDAYNEVAAKRNAAKAQGSYGDEDDGLGYIYLLSSSVPNTYKIGKAIDVENRLKGHLRNYPIEIRIEHTVWVHNRTKAETYLLKLFADKKLQGEWFQLTHDDVDWIKSLDSKQLTKLMRSQKEAHIEQNS